MRGSRFDVARPQNDANSTHWQALKWHHAVTAKLHVSSQMKFRSKILQMQFDAVCV
jgi:hypothetical protein